MIAPLGELLSREQWLQRAARVLMEVISTDSLALARLHSLAGRVIAIRIQGLDKEFYAAVDEDGLMLGETCLKEPDVTLSGRLADFASFASARLRADVVPAGALRIQGDLATAQAVQRLLDELELDWEALLARRVGDVAARQLGLGVRRGFSLLREAGAALQRDIPAWLQDEGQVTPAPDEVEHLARENLGLASAVDRLAARIQRLQGRRRT